MISGSTLRWSGRWLGRLAPRIAHALLAVLVMWGLAAMLALPASAAAEGAQAYRMGPGDVVKISVYGEESLGGSFKVKEGGTIDLPLIGRIEVLGLSPDELDLALTSRLGQDLLVNPQVTVEVATYASRPVQVLGAVRTPGIYYLNGPTTLLDILAQAGGVLNEKSSQELQVKRGASTTAEPFRIDLPALLTQGEGNLSLESGDVVLVKEGEFIYVSGDVSKPGPVVWRNGISLSQAIAAAGGANRTANLRKITLLRSGRPTRVNLKSVLKGTIADPPLTPGDQVVVGESVF